MDAEISYYEYREKGGTQVKVQATVSHGAHLKRLTEELRGPVVAPPESTPESPGLPQGPGSGQPGPPAEPAAPVAKPKIPYFDIGDGEGRVGDKVWVPVYAGCTQNMTGFDIGGGCGGYGKLKAHRAKLGTMLTEYLNAQGALEKVFSGFQFVSWDGDSALPEEWWKYGLGFFSVSKEKQIPGVPIPGIPVPSGTLLFSVEFEILPQEPGKIELTCKDQFYYTQTMRRRWNFTFAGLPGGDFALDTNGGQLTVLRSR